MSLLLGAIGCTMVTAPGCTSSTSPHCPWQSSLMLPGRLPVCAVTHALAAKGKSGRDSSPHQILAPCGPRDGHHEVMTTKNRLACHRSPNQEEVHAPSGLSQCMLLERQVIPVLALLVRAGRRVSVYLMAHVCLYDLGSQRTVVLRLSVHDPARCRADIS